ncbi:hypothetical protein [Actinoplanes regularis]|uniref:Lipoprotein n=1 Tax=Actinoplanes regularis TaxID=52697 RepID=A0A239JV51_9ACTN|nr:hypothetical protein [Actinoplanes regularis]GIE92269.1 hypothetical protein Are01nite_87490 [Actinoplanes regularis]SNT09787.1 hypothetical protein SAMN06264365_1395 [Actinoplanes regularis]
MIRRWRFGAALVVFLVAGCGSVRERADAAAGTATRLLTAVAGRDGSAACALLAPDTVADVAEAAGTSCAEAILDEDLPGPGAVTSAVVYGQWAQVRVSGDTMFLAVFGGGWRVVAAGCVPRGADRPYDCSISGG